MWGIAYFAIALSYIYKMFIKSTTDGSFIKKYWLKTDKKFHDGAMFNGRNIKRLRILIFANFHVHFNKFNKV